MDGSLQSTAARIAGLTMLLAAARGQQPATAGRTHPPVGLVGHWDFNEGRGGVVHDRAGWIGDFTSFGCPKWAKNASGTCLFLDNREGGQPVYLELPNFHPFNRMMANGKPMIESGGLSVWARPLEGGYVPDRAGRNAACIFYSTIMIVNSCWYYNVVDPEMNVVLRLRGAEVESGEWTHIAAVWDDTRARIYVNGELVRQPGGEVIVNTPKLIGGKAPFRIGLAYPWEDANRYRGYLDDLRYYSGPLTDEEVRRQYETGRGKYELVGE